MTKVYAFGYEPEDQAGQTKPCTLCEEDIYKDKSGYIVNADGTKHTCFSSEGFLGNPDGEPHTCCAKDPTPKPGATSEVTSADWDTESFEDADWETDDDESEKDVFESVFAINDESENDESEKDESEKDEPKIEPEELNCDANIEAQTPTLGQLYSEDDLLLIVKMLHGFYEGLESGEIETYPTNLKGVVQSAEGKMALGIIFDPKMR